MIGLYSILKQSSSEVKIKFTDKSHPIFKAHFPNNPILPGFLQIDVIANILNDEITNIKYSKFIAHIYPNDVVVYKIKMTAKQKIIKIEKNNKKISEIKYEIK